MLSNWTKITKTALEQSIPAENDYERFEEAQKGLNARSDPGVDPKKVDESSPINRPNSF